MCLTVPAQVISAADNYLEVETAGTRRRVKRAFSAVPQVGDWVLVNADLAVVRITEQEAEEIAGYLSPAKKV
ncbi:MAG: HypC/HybG/HupF family hydrogenase formation chaperone [Patescibacteria group bacterium]|jgi:hydrogenase assembly chaperone HypC/HupF